MGDPTFRELGLAATAPFIRREIALKGYDSLSTAWGVSFQDLREFLAARPR